jgi:hypothetical protein
MYRMLGRDFWLRSAVLVTVGLAVPTISWAQDDPNAASNAEKARLEAETARINAQAALINAQAARDRTRIESLNLPSFEGTTQLGEGVGAMETTMLSSHAVHEAARAIRGWANPHLDRPVIVLAGDESLDFSRISAIATEISAIDQVFDQVLSAEERPRQQRFLGAAGIVSAISAVAGLLRSDTDVTAVDLPVISNRLLATAVAAELPDAIVPSAAIGPVRTTGGLLGDLIALIDKRARVQAARDAIRPANPNAPTDAEKARIAPLTAALARFDAFAARVTTADANGSVPIVQADRLSTIWNRQPRVLRVYVDKAGGTVIRRTNLITTLGIDHPIRVSGGMVASFILTNPESGGVVSAGTITCRTTLSRLSWVQRGEWGNRSHHQDEAADCSPDAPAVERAVSSSNRSALSSAE